MKVKRVKRSRMLALCLVLALVGSLLMSVFAADGDAPAAAARAVILVETADTADAPFAAIDLGQGTGDIRTLAVASGVEDGAYETFRLYNPPAAFQVETADKTVILDYFYDADSMTFRIPKTYWENAGANRWHDCPVVIRARYLFANEGSVSSPRVLQAPPNGAAPTQTTMSAVDAHPGKTTSLNFWYDNTERTAASGETYQALAYCVNYTSLLCPANGATYYAGGADTGVGRQVASRYGGIYALGYILWKGYNGDPNKSWTLDCTQEKSNVLNGTYYKNSQGEYFLTDQGKTFTDTLFHDITQQAIWAYMANFAQEKQPYNYDPMVHAYGDAEGMQHAYAGEVLYAEAILWARANPGGNEEVNAILDKVYYLGYDTGLTYQWDQTNQPLVAVPMYNPEPDQGAVTVVKSSSNPEMTNQNSCYSLAGATYQLYRDAACTDPVAGGVFTIREDGSSNTIGELDVGTYYIKETAAGKGYLLDPSAHAVTVEKDQTATVSVQDAPDNDPIAVRLDKVSRDNAGGTPLSLAGAKFSVTWYSGIYDTEAAAEAAYNAGSIQRRTWIITTAPTASGKYSADMSSATGDPLFTSALSGESSVPHGTVIIKEVSAPAGYVNDPSYSVSGGEITEDGAIIFHVDGSGESAFMYVTTGNYMDEIAVTVYEPSIRGGIELTKRDSETGDAQGDATLKGAEYMIYNQNDYSITVDGKTIAPGEAAVTLTTDEAGYAATAKDALPYGVYTVQETKAPTGYKLEGAGVFKAENIPLQTDKQMYSITTLADPVWRGGIRIQKKDMDSKAAKPLGGATLEGTEFTIYNASKQAVSVMKDGTLTMVAPGEIAAVVTADQQGVAQTAKDALPFGTYEIRETGAPEGYKCSDQTYTVELRPNTVGEDGFYDMDGHGKPFYDQVVRGDFELRKINDNPQTAMGNVAFKITALDQDGKPGESHIIVTDSNGYYSTAAAPHSRNTNGGEAGDGIWFGEGSTPNDALGALPYGHYLIEELETEANPGKQMWSDTFVVYRDGVTVSYGNIVNYDKPALYTELHKEGSYAQKHIAPDGLITLADTIQYTDFDSYNQQIVTFSGQLMDAETGEPITNNEGNPITGSTSQKVREFGSAEVIFLVDASQLAGKTLVAFETATVLDENEQPVEIASHKDLADEGQKVYFPELGTEAADQRTKDHFSSADGTVTIVDTVRYTALQAGRPYVMNGKLVDKATGEPILDKSGKPVTAQKSFTPESGGSGTMEMVFSFEAADTLPGTTAVAVEEIPGVASHADLEDEEQTIYFPKIGTTASVDTPEDPTQAAPGELTIRDVVAYENLAPNRKYKLVGQLMDKESGEMVDSQTSAVTFTPESGSGTEEVRFTLDASALGGKTLVVFETLYLSEEDKPETDIASHADLGDEAQTIRIPGGHTTLTNKKTGDHFAVPGEELTLEDVISYSGLTPGKQYTAYGILMDRETGKPMLVDEKEVTGETTFTPEAEKGETVVTFQFSCKGMEDKSLVAYEYIYAGDDFVFSHADLDDEQQTIKIQVPTTSVILKKIDMDTKKTLAGATISVYDRQRNVVYTGTSDANGEFQVGILPAGDYIYMETEAPTGYTRSQQTYAFTVREDGAVEGAVTLANKAEEAKPTPTPTPSPSDELTDVPKTGNIHWSRVLLIALVMAGFTLTVLGYRAFGSRRR